MATNRDIITRAYRKAALRDAARVLSSADATVGLEEMQDLALSLPGMTWWKDVEATADYTAGENERVRVNSDSSVTVTVPVSVSSAKSILYCCDQYVLACEGYDDRAPKDGARVHITDANQSTAITYFYRADTAEWVQASGLTLGGDVPLNADMHGHLVALLALRLVSMEPLAQLSPILQAEAATGLSRMRARYGKRQEVAVDAALRSRICGSTGLTCA
jgi:hypothetical protein